MIRLSVKEKTKLFNRSLCYNFYMLIDTHCHLHDKEFFSAEQAEKCLERAYRAGIEKIICIGTSHEDSLTARDFARKHNNVYWTYGIHPEKATSEFYSGPRPSGPSTEVVRSSSSRKNEQVRSSLVSSNGLPRADGAKSRAAALRNAPNQNSLVAIGEVGLDYHYTGYDRDAQIKLFEEMLQLAVDNDLPVSFHVREAFPDFFAVVANFPKVRGVVHSFTDSKKVLKRILNETEFYVGVNGLATYSTLPTPPIERILLETDAPFLAPVPHRGGGNEPAYIADIADWLSEKLEISRQEVADVTTNNAEHLFKLR